MAKPILHLPGYQVNEYKIILTPHEELSKRILEVKKGFNEKYSITGNPSMPQLFLASFKQYQVIEERIVNRLRMIAMRQHALKVELKDFGSYPSHTIFINVTSKVPITNLVKSIRHEAQRLMKLDADNKPHFMMDAQIAIAQKLQPWQFEKGWLEYSHHHFSGKFIASSMLLMRRKEGEFKFSPIQRFDFENMPVGTKQGELFN